MKIAAIAKVIKDRGSCHIVRIHGAEDTETSMFIGTGSELYSLEGFPKPWTEAEIMTMLGMQKKQWEDVIYKEYLCDTAEDVCGMNLEDALQNEIECRKSSINLCIEGALLMGLMTRTKKPLTSSPQASWFLLWTKSRKATTPTIACAMRRTAPDTTLSGMV